MASKTINRTLEDRYFSRRDLCCFFFLLINHIEEYRQGKHSSKKEEKKLKQRVKIEKVAAHNWRMCHKTDPEDTL